MPKLILEPEDLKKLILAKYPGATIVSGLTDIEEVIIKVEEYKVNTVTPVQVNQVQEHKPDIYNRKETIPGGVMKSDRGNLKVF